MVEIPKDVITYSDIIQWEEAAKELAAIKAKEMLLRRRVFDGIFQNPIEGTMRLRIDDKHELVGINKIDRTVDEAALSAMVKDLYESGIPVDSLLKYKPSLVISEYRKLSENERNYFDHILIIKPGSPTLKLETIKDKKNVKTKSS